MIWLSSTVAGLRHIHARVGSADWRLDNVLRPLLISGRARISALAVFIGVLGGISAFRYHRPHSRPVVLSLALALVEFAEEKSLADFLRGLASLTRRHERQSTIRALMDVSHLLDGLNDDQSRQCLAAGSRPGIGGAGSGQDPGIGASGGVVDPGRGGITTASSAVTFTK